MTQLVLQHAQMVSLLIQMEMYVLRVIALVELVVLLLQLIV
jgi:hypothetical protein